jgi:hypothetical protein
MVQGRNAEQSGMNKSKDLLELTIMFDDVRGVVHLQIGLPAILSDS